MMNSLSTLYSLLFTLGFMLIISNVSYANNNLVDSLCQKVSDYEKEKCMQVMKSNKKFSSAQNNTELSMLIIKMAIKKGIEGQRFIQQVAAAKNGSSAALHQCATNNYNQVVWSFRLALLKLKDDPKDVSYRVRVAGEGADSCESALVSEHVAYPAIYFILKCKVKNQTGNTTILIASYFPTSRHFAPITPTKNLSSLSSILLMAENSTKLKE